MTFPITFLAVFNLLLLATISSAFTDPVLHLDASTFNGKYSSQFNISYFRKIQFGASTAHENRFRAPQPPAPYEGVYDTDLPFNACPQDEERGDEDCLYLGVYSRPWNLEEKKAKRPVLVVFYGGGFVRGAANFSVTASTAPSMYPVLNSSALNDFVIVYPNYRTNAFGFLAGTALQRDPKSDLNPGLLDQQAALRWVQKYIHHFGGDKDDVTIQGQSAGGGSVIAQVLANEERKSKDRLFKRALASSPFWPKMYRHDEDVVEAQFDRLASLTGCASNSSITAVTPKQRDSALACLKSIPFSTVRRAAFIMKDDTKYTTSTFSWSPVRDPSFLPSSLSRVTQSPLRNTEVAWSNSNTHEGENFIPPGFKSTNSTGGYNSSSASFDGWLVGYLPRLSTSALNELKSLYPAAGSTDLESWNSTFLRAGLVYCDSVLTCPGLWIAQAAKKGFVSEYTILPATHADDTKWWNSINAVQTANPLVYRGFAGAMASFFQTGGPNTNKLTESSVPGLPAAREGKEWVISQDGFRNVEIRRLNERCAFWKKLGDKVPL